MPYSGVDRRQGPDLTIRIYQKLTLITTLVNIALVIIVALGKPRTVTMFDRFAGQSTYGGWDGGLLDYLLLLLAFQLIVSTIGLILNYSRHHRKKDNYSLMLGGSLFISIIGLMYVIF